MTILPITVSPSGVKDPDRRGRHGRGAGLAPGLMLALVVLAAGPVVADDATLAAQGKAILDRYCIRCHGVEFNTPGLNMGIRDTLLGGGDEASATPPFLTPGNARESRIHLHASGARQPRMPPEDEALQPTAEDIALLGRWIDAGAEFPRAARPTREFLGEKRIRGMLVADLEKQPLERRPRLRYFTIAHLWNDPDTSDEQLAVTRAGISKLVNSLSNRERIVPPQPVDPDGVILRIDLGDYGWTERTHWLPLLGRYPYGLKHSDDVTRRLERLTSSDLPHVRGDWFCHEASRPELYHRLAMLPGHVGLPDTDGRLQQLLGVDLAADFAADKLIRAGMSGKQSGVSDHNRIVERHEIPTGAFWISYDSAGSGDRQNHANFPLGPRFPGQPGLAAFDHDGGEIIFSLPNGLQGYLLTTAVGKRIDVGPLAIVKDNNQHSGGPEIVNAISCMGCHREGMIAFKDSIRPLWENRPDEVADKVRRLYPPQEKLDEAVNRDRERFMAALELAVGPFLSTAGAPLDRRRLPEPVTDVSKRYASDLSLADVARELGLPTDAEAARAAGIGATADELATVIRSSERLRSLELGPLATGESIKRGQWERNNQRVSRELGLGTPLEVQ